MIAYGDKEPELAEPKIVGEMNFQSSSISYAVYNIIFWPILYRLKTLEFCDESLSPHGGGTF